MDRFSYYGTIFFNKFYQFLPVFRAVGLKKLCLTPSSFFSSFSRSAPESKKLTLTPLSSLVKCSKGLKHKMVLQLRCKDCYYVRKDGNWYVMCSSYPRHKQRQKTKKEKYTWLLTYASQSKQRPW